MVQLNFTVNQPAEQQPAEQAQALPKHDTAHPHDRSVKALSVEQILAQFDFQTVEQALQVAKDILTTSEAQIDDTDVEYPERYQAYLVGCRQRRDHIADLSAQWHNLNSLAAAIKTKASELRGVIATVRRMPPPNQPRKHPWEIE